MDKSTSTAPCDSETFSRELNQAKVHVHVQPSVIMTIDSKESLMQYPVTRTSVDSSEPAYKAIQRCHDKLVTALSTNILRISGILLAQDFVSEEVHDKVLLPTSTPEEKATDLVVALRTKIKLVPD